MKPGATNLVAHQSKVKARYYYQRRFYGRAFAHLLIALKLMPEWKFEFKVAFSTTLSYWSQILERQKRFKDLFKCYEQAIEIFPENEDIYYQLAGHLFRSQYLLEAARYYRLALQRNENHLPSYHCLQSVSSSLVQQWHFRMLNDSHRNEAYREAIMKKICQGFKSVLDIGTGTGILSLYAVTAGASSVHACDYSQAMCTIAKQVVEANEMGDKINVINKLSNDLTVPGDIPNRKSLLVTETMDSGLLGEHLLQTLLHAWDQLLKPACPQLLSSLHSEKLLTQHGIVIPFGAHLWAAPIRCPSVARGSYLIDQDNGWAFKRVWLHSEETEPYDAENLRSFHDCKFLDDPVAIFTFDFNNPSQLRAYFEGEFDDKLVSFQFEGKCDAIAVWFDIMLDEDITISSSPILQNKHCCWDQALFKFRRTELKSVSVKVGCGGGKLKCVVVKKNTNIEQNNDENVTSEPSNLGNAEILPELPVSVELLRFLNNKPLQEYLFKFAEQIDKVEHVLDLSPFPTLGLRFVQLKSATLVCVLKSEQDVKAVKEFMKDNSLDETKVKCIVKEELAPICTSGGEKRFDFIFNNYFQSTGGLNDSNGSSLDTCNLKNVLAVNGVLTPVTLTVVGQLIDCDWISQVARVTDNELTETYNIAQFINMYKASELLDIDLRNIEHSTLSEATDCLQLNNTELGAEFCLTKTLTVNTTQDGCVTGVAMWYKYQLTADGEQLTTRSEWSHISQKIFVVEPPYAVKSGEAVAVVVRYHLGIIRIQLETKTYYLVSFSHPVVVWFEIMHVHESFLSIKDKHGLLPKY